MHEEQFVWSALENIEQTPSRKKKRQILEKLAKDTSNYGRRLREIVEYACNPVWTYGVINTKTYEGGKTKDWQDFVRLLNLLKDRKLTGGKASGQVTDLLKKSHFPKWYQRVLNRDLNIGVGVDTFLKVFPGLFPVMKPMLCQKYEGGDLPRPYFAQPKLDGLRCVIIVDEKKNMVALSRNNKPLNNLDHIFKELRKVKRKGYVLDGELYGYNWNNTLSVASTDTAHAGAKKIKFFVFDFVRLHAWKAKDSVVKLQDKIFAIHDLAAGKKYIKVLTYGHTAQTQEEIRAKFEYFHDKGYEGIVLKDPESVYKFKRSSNWLKVKAVNEDDFKVVGVEKGDIGGRNEHVMGSLIVQGTTTFNKKQYRIRTHVGTGFSDKKRADFWKNRKEMIGKTVQVEFQEVALTTKPQKVYALRFPVFVRVRNDK